MDVLDVEKDEQFREKEKVDMRILRPSKQRPLLPILLSHPMPAGALVVDKEGAQIVYLAPLMSTTKEIYFAKHKEVLTGNNSVMVNSEKEKEENGSQRQLLASIERHLAKLRKPEQQEGSQNQQQSSSLFDVPTADSLNRSNPPATTSIGAVASPDGQLKRMKQRVKLMPISDEDHTSFWETIKGYERMRAYYHQTVVAGGASTPMGFNMEAAFKRMLLDERHQHWVSIHENRLENNKIRKVQEDENYERRAIETSSGFRAQQRLQRRMREQLICEAQNMQPIVMLSAFTQKMLNLLVMHWSQRRLENHLSRTLRIWREYRSIKRTNLHAAHLLVEWLQKSVTVKSVGFRVFRGLRIFVRRVKCVQGLWRKKQAIRKLKFLIVEKAWIELEAQLVDAAMDEYESKRIETDENGAQKRSPKKRKDRELWMRFVPESIRSEVILEFLQKVGKEYQEKFRNQEIEFFPQLIQTLRGEHPNRARTYIRAVAAQHALCGKVIETLLRYPGAVGDGVIVVEPFDVHLAPIGELIKEMQTDELVRQVLQTKASHESEEYKKQLAWLLQRRQQLRQAVPITEVLSSEQQQPLPAQRVESVAPDRNPEAVIPKKSFALVSVSYNFKNLPTLSERTKDVATSLFDSLVGQRFNRFAHRGSRLLINPSVIEFQDTMKDLKKICAKEPDSSFFMCLSTHGARVTHGTNEGSYVLFSETRLSSEEELVLTAIHERELAEMINDIPCRSKFIALELCQTQEPKDKVTSEAETIRYRIHEQFFSQLYNRVVQLRLQTLLDRNMRSSSTEKITAEAVKRNPELLNLILMESCDVKTEVPVRANEERVSNFLLRFRDAFRGAALIPELDEENDIRHGPRRSFFAKKILEYVCRSIREDAIKHNDLVHTEYKSQVRTRYEHAAEFVDITHTPSVLGAEHAIDFGLGEIPEPPTVAPTPPSFTSSTLNSISLTWNFTSPATNTDLPIVLGYHIQRRGHGRACVDGAGEASVWKRAAAFQVLSYEDVVRNGCIPPTTVTVFGLATDTAYCFRARARTVGGWGPFSAPSTGFRTLSATSTMNQHEAMRIAALQEGAKGIAKLMDKHRNIGSVQRYAAEILAAMAMKGPKAGMQPLEPTDLPVVVAVRSAMLKFKKDMHLQQHGCLLFGRLAGSSAPWRTALESMGPPSLLTILRNIVARPERDINTELTRCATWALEQVQIGHTTLQQKPHHVLSEHEAAIKLQGLYRCRKARENLRAMARSVYTQAIDPTSGMTYVFNTRTGATYWELPRFAS